MKTIKLLLSGVLLLITIISSYAQEQEHPFMIINKEKYQDFIQNTKEPGMTYMHSRATREWHKSGGF